MTWSTEHTREKNLVKLGLSKQRAWKSSVNGRGPWWNAGASHMNQAITKARLARLGLVSVPASFPVFGQNGRAYSPAAHRRQPGS